jgi:phenylacetate-CoA ligase
MGAIHSLYHLHRLYRRLTWPEEKIERLRHLKLTSLLSYCYHNIPYYQDQFKTLGAEPGDFKTVNDLSNFPILDKETLRDRWEEFHDPLAGRENWIHYRSSGSTGIPLELWYHPAERLRMGFTVTRELQYNGMKPWHRIVNVTEPRHSGPKNKWYHRLGFMNEKFLSVYDKSDLNLSKLTEIKPHVIIGFPSILMLIGQELSSNKSISWRPQLLFTLAEVLTPEDRLLMKRLWGTEPIDFYGANEVGHIAFQCSLRQGYHINVDSVHLELLSGQQPVSPGDRGEVVVTNFDLRIMPIIRYRVGDIARTMREKCSCGCRFPLLQEVAGRSDGFIIGDGGRVFSALEISLMLKSIEGIRQFRLIQNSANSIKVEWIPSTEASSQESQIRATLEERLGPQMKIEVRIVNDIPREQSGKIRSVISELPNPFWEN